MYVCLCAVSPVASWPVRTYICAAKLVTWGVGPDVNLKKKYWSKLFRRTSKSTSTDGQYNYSYSNSSRFSVPYANNIIQVFICQFLRCLNSNVGYIGLRMRQNAPQPINFFKNFRGGACPRSTLAMAALCAAPQCVAPPLIFYIHHFAPPLPKSLDETLTCTN